MMDAGLSRGLFKKISLKLGVKRKSRLRKRGSKEGREAENQRKINDGRRLTN
jgi:hypothetical protein